MMGAATYSSFKRILPGILVTWYHSMIFGVFFYSLFVQLIQDLLTDV